MRNITKILLLVAFAFVVYLLWPRTADFRGFNPAELAKLQADTWAAAKAGNEMAALWGRFRIYTSQYGMSPVAAFRVAQTQSNGILNLQRSIKEDSGDAENDSLNALREKYTLIKDELKDASFSPDDLAREEFYWRTLVEKGASPAEIATPISGILAAFYGGSAADFREVATDLAGAQLEALGKTPEDSAAPVRLRLQETFQLLKEIAATPPAAPAS